MSPRVLACSGGLALLGLLALSVPSLDSFTEYILEPQARRWDAAADAGLPGAVAGLTETLLPASEPLLTRARAADHAARVAYLRAGTSYTSYGLWAWVSVCVAEGGGDYLAVAGWIGEVRDRHAECQGAGN